MEAQDLYQAQVSKLFERFNPHPQTISQLPQFLKKECRKRPDNAKEFLTSLISHPPTLINFDAFCSIVRIIKKAVIPFKSEQLQVALSDFIINHAKLYFPYIKNANPKQFKELLDLFEGIAVRQPQNLSDHRHVVLFLCKNAQSQEFANRIVELINNEVLVEKKSQNFKSFKINQFFAQFIVKHIEKLMPQLERLLVRSESNLEVWEQFVTTVRNWKGIDSHLLAIIKRIKHLYMTNPQVSTKIIVTLTSQLTDEKVIKECVTYFASLFGGQHNAKKKIIYVRMLQGVISSLKQQPDQNVRNLVFQDILVMISNGLIKFTEEEEFNILIGIADTLVELITEPKDDIAKALKLYLKNTNKYILIMMGLIVSGVYRKEHVDSLPSVKEIFTHFKTQLPTLIKKTEVNWQWLLPIFHFLSNYELQFIEHLSEDNPLFKVSCLSLSKPEMNIGLQLILKKLEHLKSEEEDISDIYYVISALLLQEIKQKQSWQKFIRALTPTDKVHLVSRGLFPLTLFSCQQLKKNKGNQFQSLLSFMCQQLSKQKVELQSSLDFVKIVACYANHKKVLKNSLSVAKPNEFKQIVQRYARSSLFDIESDEQNKINCKEMDRIQGVTVSLLKYSQEYLVKLIQSFTTQEYYKKDLNFLINFESEINTNIEEVKNEMIEWRSLLVDKQIHKVEEVKPRKTYVGATFEVKMMSEQEVKQQKYRIHFRKMVRLFDQIAHLFLITFNDHELLNTLWHNHLKTILAITNHPQHRHSIMKLVKHSCLFTAETNKKCKQARVFLSHAEFLSQFFAFRNSGITPSVKIMEHCQRFLKELLQIPFESKQTTFTMLQDQKSQFIMLFVNQVCEYLLENMEFDLNLKKLAIKFYDKCFSKKISFGKEHQLFGYVVKNINILSSSQHIQSVLLSLLNSVDANRYKQIFGDILNFVQSTKKLILQTINLLEGTYKPEFEEFIKLKILSLESNQQISKLATQALSSEVQLKNSILTFDMKNFVKKNSKETIEKLCLFIKQEITPANTQAIFLMVLKASQQLFDEGFDQQGLEMLPYFLEINIEHINEVLFKPIFHLLTTKFTSKEQFGTLNKMSVDVGIDIIKRNAKEHAQKLLLVLQSFINKATGVSNIIFLGVLAPYLEGNKNLQIIEKRITELFKGHNEGDQRAISKCMPDLMSFFKQPLEIVHDIFVNIGTMKEEQQVGQSYLFTGLLKGIGYNQTQEYLDKTISSDYVTKTKLQKSGRIYLLHAFVQNFGRVAEIKSIKIIEIILGYMADNAEDIRNLAKRTGQNLILKMSSFSVKILLPQLLKGLEEQQNWRVKISYIWILGIMANCSAKQLQTSLPIIVPSLSTCLSNAHPTIREKASEALNLIGQTIKNPEISQCVDILIEALQNPFEKSAKAIDILLKTSFNHYIDPPSLSMIIPILDYCMRGRSSELKAGACQVIGSIVELIANSYDLLPYLRIIITGIRIALCDPLPEIRRIASMAIGKISTKIGIKEAEDYFKFVLQIIQSSNSNSIERQGAAQAHAEIICSQTYEYFEEGLYKLFDRLNSVSHSEKQGYILVFLYVPSIKTQQFQGFIKEVNENMYCFVSDQDEVIRNSAMLVQKVLINNYCLSHTDLLLEPLCDGAFDNNWKKRNAAIILIGEILNIIKSHMYNTRSNDKAYAYYRGLMAVYIMKDDDLQMTRLTANQVWNTYIENTPKTIKTGIEELVKMWTKWTHATGGVVFKNIVAFSTKYGQNYFTEILDFLPNYLKEPEHQVGVFEVLAQFIKRLNNQFLSKESYKALISELFTDNLFVISENVRPALAKCLALYVDKLHEQRFFEDLLYPMISRMDQTDQSNSDYTYNLHLVKDLLNTNSNKVVDRVINKVMETPMSEFKIEVITNNAERLANYLYSHFKRPATELLVEEIYSLVDDKAKENRLSLIIYCLQQVSLQLNARYKTEFIKMINSNITKRIEAFESNKDPKQKKMLKIFVNMVIFFLNSTPLQAIDDLDIIIGQISPLIFFEDKQLSALGHKIYLLVITDCKSYKTAEYIKQMTVSFENKLTKTDQHIWEDQQVLKDYISILVKGIAYGKEEVMEESLDMIDFLIQHTPRTLIENYILKIVGPIIRISNYPLLQKQKIRIMELLISILNQNFKINAYNNQILSVCLRLLQEYRNSQEIIEIVANTYFSLLKITVLKQDLVLSILAGIKSVGQNLIQSFYYFIKSIVKEGVELPKTAFEKVFEEITATALNNTDKVSVKGVYYASKTSARIGVLLGKPIERIQSQIKGVTVSYESILNYLHNAYYKKARIQRMESVEIFLKESNREKIFYLLKSLRLCKKHHEQVSKLYSQEYLKSIIPESMVGFEQISDILDDFESEKKEEEEVDADINKS